MTYTADPNGYSIAVDDSSLAPSGDSIIIPTVVHGSVLVVTYDNGELAGMALPLGTSDIPIWVANVYLTQSGPGSPIGPPWLAAIHVINESVSYGGVMGVTSNVLTWSVHGPQPGDTPLLIAGAGDQADMTGSSPVPSHRSTPYWQGISVLLDNSWASGFWSSTPTIGSFPDLDLQNSGTGANAVSTVDCTIQYGSGIYFDGPYRRVQSGGGTIQIDAFIFTDQTETPTNGGAPTEVAAWGVLGVQS